MGRPLRVLGDISSESAESSNSTELELELELECSPLKSYGSLAEQKEERTKSPSSLENIWRKRRMMGAEKRQVR